MKTLLIISILFLNACTVTIVDKRLSREEVAAAFQERDQLISKMATAIQKLQEVPVKKK